jgi:hypothetical protein
MPAFVCLINARGIDLRHVAGNASNLDGVARPRVLSPREIKLRKELKLSLEVTPTAQGKGSRVYRKLAYAFTDLAYAMSGIPRMPELAFLYSYAGLVGCF